jgi:hypothetical protein
MVATLSQIRAWSTEHLVDAAGHWTTTADQWEDAFIRMRNQSYSLTWNGDGGDGLRQQTSADLSIVSGKADQLRQAAGIARSGASEVSAAQRRVLYGVEDAHNAGFQVGEDLSVTDARTSRTAAEQAARRARAQTFAADLRARTEQLVGTEHRVAGQLSATTAGVGNLGFAQTGNGIQLVDLKQDSGAAPPPQPGFIDQFEGQLTSPGPQAPPPSVPIPTSSGPPKPFVPDTPGPMPTFTHPQPFGRCVGAQVKANVGKDMVEGGFKSAIKGAVTGAAGGAAITPELLGAGGIPGGVLGFVGGFTKGLVEAPIKAAIEGAWDCADLPKP